MAKLTRGKLEVICGSMFSGKTEELIRRMRRAQYAQLKTQVFKHSLDNRITTENIHSHSGDKVAAIAIDTATGLKDLVLPDVHIIGIDEVQFFSIELVSVIQSLLEQGKHIIAAGLDLDFRGVPFGCIPPLLALADTITKLQAVCIQCGDDAHFTQRLVNGKPAKFTDPVILVGAEECYQARCRECYRIDQHPKEFYF